MLKKSTLNFLKQLKQNNNRDWFNENKHLYEDAKNNFDEFTDEMIQYICRFDKSIEHLQPKDCTYRIYRDIRFSKDKTPYKTWMGAVINEGGRKNPIAGYYFHIQPNSYFLAGGLYMPEPEKLYAVRNAIVKSNGEFRKIVNAKEFKKYFGGFWNDKLKTAPKGFPKDHPDVEFLKYKSFLVEHRINEKQLLSKDIFNYSVKVFKAMKPLIDFLNEAK
jgi:uncharacterized protein (TIGR02453 family)